MSNNFIIKVFFHNNSTKTIEESDLNEYLEIDTTFLTHEGNLITNMNTIKSVQRIDILNKFTDFLIKSIY